MGYDGIEAANGEEAWEKLPSHQADLLLTDWTMPVMDGFEPIQKVCRMPEYRSLFRRIIEWQNYRHYDTGHPN